MFNFHVFMWEEAHTCQVPVEAAAFAELAGARALQPLGPESDLDHEAAEMCL